ncbi:hypothetical protein GCM10025795_50960 [Verticiella sediminum]
MSSPGKTTAYGRQRSRAAQVRRMARSGFLPPAPGRPKAKSAPLGGQPAEGAAWGHIKKNPHTLSRMGVDGDRLRGIDARLPKKLARAYRESRTGHGWTTRHCRGSRYFQFTPAICFWRARLR